MAGLASFPSFRCIPYMLKEEGGEESGCQDVLGRLQVLMISTPKRGDLIFPKVRQQNHMIMHALTHTHTLQSILQRISICSAA